MAGGITIRFEDASVRSLLRDGDKIARAAAVAALNKAAAKVRTKVKRKAADNAGVQVSAIGRRLKKLKNATQAAPVAIVRCSTRPLHGARSMSASQDSTGVNALGASFPHAFIMKEPFRGRLIVVKRKGKARLPLTTKGVGYPISKHVEKALKEVSEAEVAAMVREILPRELKFRAQRHAALGR